jgi:hypothetical protein
MSGWNAQYRDPRLLPDKLVRMLPLEERKRLGRHCMTQEERQEKIDAKSEKQLQENIASLIRQRGITFNVSRMDRATTGKIGWPDFTFALPRKPYGIPCAIECKLPGQEPTREQVECMMALVRDGWFVRVVRSEQEFLDALKELEAT